MRLRRSRLLPRLLWIGARAVAPLSTRAAGYLAFVLWYVPWQRPARTGTPWPAGTRHHRTAVGRRRVDVHEVGDGPTVLLVHGWADRAASLTPVATALVDAGWHVVAVDLPAHGDAPGVRADLIVNAEVVAALTERYPVDAVVAHSLGAAATALALRDGGTQVRSAVLLAPIVDLTWVVRRFLAEVRLPARVEPGLRRWIERRFGPEVWTDVATDRNLVRCGLRGLVIADEDDRRAPIADARALVAAWPGGELHTTRGLGHARLLRDEAVVARVVGALEPDARWADVREPA